MRRELRGWGSWRKGRGGRERDKKGQERRGDQMNELVVGRINEKAEQFIQFSTHSHNIFTQGFQGSTGLMEEQETDDLSLLTDAFEAALMSWREWQNMDAYVLILPMLICHCDNSRAVEHDCDRLITSCCIRRAGGQKLSWIINHHESLIIVQLPPPHLVCLICATFQIPCLFDLRSISLWRRPRPLVINQLA